MSLIWGRGRLRARLNFWWRFESVDEHRFLKIWGWSASRLQKYKICLPLVPPPCNSVTSRLINLKFSGNATFYIYFISQKRIFFEKVLWGCHVGTPLFRGRGRLRARLKFWFRFDVSGLAISLATCRSLKNKVFVMETFFMSLRLFSATSAYFCDLKSEWPQIFKKWCSSTDSKIVGNRWLANSNAFYVKQLWRMSEIALASPNPNMS